MYIIMNNDGVHVSDTIIGLICEGWGRGGVISLLIY